MKKLALEGIFMINSVNPRIDKQIGKVFYSLELEKFLFKLTYSENEEYLGYYVINIKNVSKIAEHEEQLLSYGGKTKVKRPKGYEV